MHIVEIGYERWSNEKYFDLPSSSSSSYVKYFRFGCIISFMGVQTLNASSYIFDKYIHCLKLSKSVYSVESY